LSGPGRTQGRQGRSRDSRRAPERPRGPATESREESSVEN
jgi:hypothetical protein